MYEPENENEISEQTNETVSSGEYRYGGGFEKESIYSDAHYTSADDNTVPPRYYTPPEPKRPVKKEKSGKGGKLIGLIALCLVCAILGGVVGAGSMSGRLSERVESLEKARNELVLAQAARDAAESEGTVATPVSSGAALTAAQLYDQACKQVVGVTTEVTYTNFFGMNSSSAVSGTGFIVSSDGYILTNYHVIELAAQNNKDVNVILHDGTRYVASIVGYSCVIDAERHGEIVRASSAFGEAAAAQTPNGQALAERVNARLRLMQAGEKGTVFLIDLTNYHEIAEHLEEANPGGFLRAVTDSILADFRGEDILGQVSESLFVLFICGHTSLDIIERRAQRIIELVHRVSIQGFEDICVSVGVAATGTQGVRYRTLYSRAASALDTAKTHGENNYRVYFEEEKI